MDDFKNWARWHARRARRRHGPTFVALVVVVILCARHSYVFAFIGAVAVLLMLLNPRP